MSKQPIRRGRSLSQDLVLGIGGGLAIALLLCVYAAILYLLRGAESFVANDVTLGAAISVYIVGGVIAGAVVGVLLPITRWRWGAALVGFLAAMPVFAIVRALLEGFRPWTSVDTIVMILWALTLGSSVGWIYWRIFHSDDSAD